MISDLIQNKKLNPIVTELFVRGRQLNISLIFVMQWYLKVPYNVILNSMHYFIIKLSNKREPPRIAINHSSDIVFKDFMKIYKKWTAESCSLLVNNDSSLPSDDPPRFRKKL